MMVKKRSSISCLGALLVILSLPGCDPDDEDLDTRNGYLVNGECVCEDDDFRALQTEQTQQAQDVQLPQKPQAQVDPDDDDEDDEKGVGLAPDSTMNVAPVADDECICDED
jgi:hypothetical protein